MFHFLPMNEDEVITFNIIPLQGNVLSPSLFELAFPFQIEVFFLVPALAGQCACSHVTATECGLKVLPHPYILPIWPPSDFYLLSKLKSNLCGTQFRSNEGIIEAVN